MTLENKLLVRLQGPVLILLLMNAQLLMNAHPYESSMPVDLHSI